MTTITSHPARRLCRIDAGWLQDYYARSKFATQHPLMSGMNAFSGVTVLGCLMATALAVHWGSKVLGFVAIVLAMINVVSGFGVTHRMLMMFHSSSKTKKGEDK